ncbi:hypothetical protein Adeg_0242 [Ammonifex degensii KC4]|uniref:Uncharacterized protein n=1 Tax=Ammonifex degensii (strain DSM 10501 / KC4) TaxID=429009 RepID=C9RAY4_AMMDK|nr:hypothetical protein [Ammonifex degensii]ACX51411.1 hypothetical protein Adeg_0242 [Ammonifex degensii KC4]
MKTVRLNIYLDDPILREKVKIAAARRGVTVSAYALMALRRQLAEDGLLPAAENPQEAARALDDLRKRTGPIGVPVRLLIEEGRNR